MSCIGHMFENSKQLMFSLSHINPCQSQEHSQNITWKYKHHSGT